MKAYCLEALNKAFTEAGSRFIVVGGLAVVAHGYLRATQDADIVIELLPDNIKRAFAALNSLGYKPNVPITTESFSVPENRLAWTKEKNMTVLQFWSNRFRETPVDVFIDTPFDFATEWDLAYRQPLGNDPQEIRFASLSTLIEMKEKASRPQDLVDIEHLKWLLEEESKGNE